MKEKKRKITQSIGVIAVTVLCAVLLVSCSTPGPLPAEDTTGCDPSQNPVEVHCSDSEYSSYVLPEKENTTGKGADELYSDGKIHILQYSYARLSEGLGMTLEAVFTFPSFISLQNGEYNIPYLFRGGKTLKIIVGFPGEFYYSTYYNVLPAVFGAFEDIILPLSFTEPLEKISVMDGFYAGFEYGDEKYYVLPDGTVYRNDKIGKTKITEEQAALFFAYKYAYMFAAGERRDNYKYFSPDGDGYNTVVLNRNGSESRLTGNEASDFLKKYSSAPDEAFLQSEYGFSFRCDVNLPDNTDHGAEVLRFAVCKGDQEEIAAGNRYILYSDGRITCPIHTRMEQNFDTRQYLGIYIPDMILVSIDRFPTE